MPKNQTSQLYESNKWPLNVVVRKYFYEQRNANYNDENSTKKNYRNENNNNNNIHKSTNNNNPSQKYS
jgi:hypothetical protein